jgi:hypothetical protein
MLDDGDIQAPEDGLRDVLGSAHTVYQGCRVLVTTKDGIIPTPGVVKFSGKIQGING